jgi:hypothetical protein
MCSAVRTLTSSYINHPIALVSILALEGGVTDIETLCAVLAPRDTERMEDCAQRLENRACEMEEIALSIAANLARTHKLAAEHGAAHRGGPSSACAMDT